jgi:hypothetical protein
LVREKKKKFYPQIQGVTMWREDERVVAHGRPKRSQRAWLAAAIRRAPTHEAKEHAATGQCSARLAARILDDA